MWQQTTCNVFCMTIMFPHNPTMKLIFLLCSVVETAFELKVNLKKGRKKILKCIASGFCMLHSSHFALPSQRPEVLVRTLLCFILSASAATRSTFSLVLPHIFVSVGRFFSDLAYSSHTRIASSTMAASRFYPHRASALN